MIIDCNGDGRFANSFLRNLCGYFVAKQYDIKGVFKNVLEFKKLGIDFSPYQSKRKHTFNPIFLDDSIIMNYVHKKVEITTRDLSLKHIYCQTKEFSEYTVSYFDNLNNAFCKSIIEKNPFKNNYDNNDLIVHMRLDDIYEYQKIRNYQYLPGTDYFEYVLNTVRYHKGYITSDSINDPQCQLLINKYDLKPITYDKINTIYFASTIKNIVLSAGSYSYLIGLLGFFSRKYYFNPEKLIRWCGPIFDGTNWEMVDI